MLVTPLSALPQHVAQVIGIALGVAFVGFGTLFLVKGVPPEFAWKLSPRLVRVVAGLQIAVGIALALAFFFIDADGNSRDGDDWGGSFGIVLTLVFLAFVAGIAVYNLRRFREAERRAREDSTPRRK